MPDDVIAPPVQPVNIPVNPPAPKPAPTPVQTPPVAAPTKGPRINMPPLLWKQSQELLANIENKLGGAVVSYFTRGSIVNDDVKYFYTHLSSIGHVDKLYFILVSSGGDGKSAFRIASLLKCFCSELVIVVPEVAASAATMLSLAGDSIIMTPLAYLTAVDTSIVHPLNPKDNHNNPVRVELEEVRRAVDTFSQANGGEANKSEVYKTIFNYIHPVAFGSMERTSNLSEMLCRDILTLRNTKPTQDETNSLINKLNHDYPAHGYPITRNIAKGLGLPVVDSDAQLDTLLWKYSNVSRFLTEPVRTDFSDSFFHTENYLTSIESVGRRIAVRQVIERRLDPIIKGWTNLREDYKWESVYEVEENGERKVKVTYLDF